VVLNANRGKYSGERGDIWDQLWKGMMRVSYGGYNRYVFRPDGSLELSHEGYNSNKVNLSSILASLCH
jgi:hypothetical protein